MLNGNIPITERVGNLEALYHKNDKANKQVVGKMAALEDALVIIQKSVEDISLIKESAEAGSADGGTPIAGAGKGVSKEEIFDILSNSKEFDALLEKINQNNIKAEMEKYQIKPLLKNNKKGGFNFKILLVSLALLFMIAGSAFYYFKFYTSSHPTVTIPGGATFYNGLNKGFSFETDFIVDGFVDNKGVFHFQYEGLDYKIEYKNTAGVE